MLSDNDSDSYDEVPEFIPAKLHPHKGGYNDGADQDAQDDSEAEEVASDDNSELDADEFVVEAILAHDFDKKGKVLYQIKWKDYDKEEDLTWEPEENL